MVLGGSAAFQADAEVWMTIRDNPVADNSNGTHNPNGFLSHGGAHWNSGKAWIMETLATDHFALRGLTVLRKPFAFCIVSVSGQCRYPEQLLIAASLVPGLVERQPALCLTLGQRRCNRLPQTQVQ